ncbi:MAG: hypothetical protein H8E55_41170 [Pelagibacterales bacterium]|nr:hypothetical protein [Pelagibacterales bacterium]
MVKLTEADWPLLIERFIYYLEKDHLRAGQAYMNALGDINAELYKELLGTEHDCFYDDELIINFLRRLNE